MTRSQYGLLTIGLAFIAATSFYTGKYTNVEMRKPYRTVCFQEEGKELHNFTPAYWVEKDGMKQMDYQLLRLKCRGEVGGFMMDWESDQFWLRRSGAKKVTTR